MTDLDKQAGREEGRYTTKDPLIKFGLADAGHLQLGEGCVASGEGKQGVGERVGGGGKHSEPTLKRRTKEEEEEEEQEEEEKRRRSVVR